MLYSLCKCTLRAGKELEARVKSAARSMQSNFRSQTKSTRREPTGQQGSVHTEVQSQALVGPGGRAAAQAMR